MIKFDKIENESTGGCSGDCNGCKCSGGDAPVYIDDIFTIDDFILACESGAMTDDDGIGQGIINDSLSEDYICPSDAISGLFNPLVTHVIWFNK